MIWWGNVRTRVISPSHVKGLTRWMWCAGAHTVNRRASAACSRLQSLHQDRPLFWVRRLPMRSEIVTRCSNLHTRPLIREQLRRARSKLFLLGAEPGSADPQSGRSKAEADKGTCCLQLYYIYRVLQLVTGETRSGFSQQSFSTYKFMQIYVLESNTQNAHSYVWSSAFFSSNHLGNIHDESKKGMGYFFCC